MSFIEPANPTMSSREIAELTGKEHKHVMRDVRGLREQLGDLFGGSVQTWTHPQNGQAYEQFVLDKDTCLTLLLGYDAVARMKVVKRWQELERKKEQRDPMDVLADPAAMRGLLLTYTEKVIALENTVAEQAPKVEALDRLATANGSLCVTDAAKALQVQPRQFFAWLRENRYIYRRTGSTSCLGYQDRVMTGLLEHKVTTVQREDGSEKVVEQVRITPKGLAKIALALQVKEAA